MSSPPEIEVRRDVDLTPFNTFGVGVRAERLAEIGSTDALLSVLRTEQPPFSILGGGSNVLLTRDLTGVTLKNSIQGIEVVDETLDSVVVSAGGGVNWHEFVTWALDRDLGGVENLALIPGTVGAAPIQNIGAYGVELKDVFEGLTAVRMTDGKTCVFAAAECAFDYRQSIFKSELKGQYFITRVRFRLTRRNHKLRLDYGAIREELSADRPTIQDVARAVIAIRRQKLPDPAQLGNAGSFFKNPTIPADHFDRLQAEYPDIVRYPAAAGRVKIPAGWLIERCGWKGKRVGRVGCYEKQALVLVNYGGATGLEIWRHAERVAESVYARFGIELHAEVNVW